MKRLALALIALSALALWLYRQRVTAVPPQIPFRTVTWDDNRGVWTC
jgi:hypothetical protein